MCTTRIKAFAKNWRSFAPERWYLQARLTLLTALVLWAQSCSLTTQLPPAQTTGSAPLPNTWWVSGKLSIANEERQETLKVHWHRATSDHDRIRLSGPLGMHSVQLERINEGLFWRIGDTLIPMEAVDLSPDVRRAAATLPIAHLGDWIIGTPVIDRHWDVTTVQRRAVGQWYLPAKIILQQDDLRITVILQNWNLNP